MCDFPKHLEQYLDGNPVYRKGWIEEAKKFQSLTKKERDAYCSHCGCTGGCNLCEKIPKNIRILPDEEFDLVCKEYQIRNGTW